MKLIYYILVLIVMRKHNMRLEMLVKSIIKGINIRSMTFIGKPEKLKI